MNIYEFTAYVIAMMSVGWWLYAILSDINDGELEWAFWSFMIFPVGVLRGIYLDFR